MKTMTYSIIALTLLLVVIAGCTTGNPQLVGMTAPEIRDEFKLGITTMDDVRAKLGEPMEKGVQTVPASGTNSSSEAKLVWYYRYQKVSGRFFTPFIPIRPQDNLRGRLMLGFNSSNILEHVDYYGNQ